jgi:hypothetical protein
VSARSFWPPAEAAQADYERLRAHLLGHGTLPDDLAAARFARRGLAGLITWPLSEPVFAAELLGAARAPWSPHADERVSALAATRSRSTCSWEPIVPRPACRSVETRA